MKNTEDEKVAVLHACSAFLHESPQKNQKELLSELIAEYEISRTPGDFYGRGPLIEDFEKTIAALVGKPAAVFMPSGTMAQPIALRIWSERKGIKNVAFHPKSHLELHEQKAYEALHGLRGLLVGKADALITLKDLTDCKAPLATLLLELPQREIGGVLPGWEDLREICAWAKSSNIALHLDGARLWECQPFYQRSYAEIAGLFDSVYVSFYKGLGGLAGAILAGDEDFITQAKIWKRRQGGELITLFPYLLSARRSLNLRLEKMAAYHAKAKELADLLSSYAVSVTPPHTNMMHIRVRASQEALENANLEIARKHGVHLFGWFGKTEDPAIQLIELTLLDGALELPRERIQILLAEFFARVSE